MRYKWLNHKDNHKLIVFFNGWGMDECVVKHLECEDYNVLMFYDYNTLDVDFDFSILNIYPEKNLIAWSMGVMVASLIQPLTRHFVTPSPSRGEGRVIIYPFIISLLKSSNLCLILLSTINSSILKIKPAIISLSTPQSTITSLLSFSAIFILKLWN